VTHFAQIIRVAESTLGNDSLLDIPAKEAGFRIPRPVMAKYTHRKRLDGSWDSICMTCYQTAAKSHTEPELIETELIHNCEGPPQSHPAVDVYRFQRKPAD
jgi:hypothetical protein